jgi:hypothetical protein
MDPVPTTNNKIKILPPGEPVVVRGIVSSVVVFFFSFKGWKTEQYRYVKMRRRTSITLMGMHLNSTFATSIIHNGCFK